MYIESEVLPNILLTGIDAEKLETGNAEERGYSAQLSEPAARDIQALPEEIRSIIKPEGNTGRIITISVPEEYMPDGNHIISFRFSIGEYVSEEFTVEVITDKTVPVMADIKQDIIDSWRR